METVEQISIPLARMFNLSLKEGVISFEWKEANIIPLFKKGLRNKWIDVGSPIDIIYLHFQRVFDEVPHQILIFKLKAHGIGDSIINWIEKWLTYSVL